jgi:hypothetical protein
MSRTLTQRKCRDTEECLQRHRRPTSNNSFCALAQAASRVKVRGIVRPLLSAPQTCCRSSLSPPLTTLFLEWNAGGACAPTKASSSTNNHKTDNCSRYLSMYVSYHPSLLPSTLGLLGASYLFVSHLADPMPLVGPSRSLPADPRDWPQRPKCIL